MAKKVILERHRTGEFGIYLDNKRISIPGARNGMPGTKEVDKEVYDYLNMQTYTFQMGELVVSSKSLGKNGELLEEMIDKESYEKNALTREEVEEKLNGNTNAMKKWISSIEEVSTKEFILEVAKDIKLDSTAKLKILRDNLGFQIPVEDMLED